MAHRGDVHLLPQVELSAARRFSEFGYGALEVDVPTSNETLERRQYQGRVWVVDDFRVTNIPVVVAVAPHAVIGRIDTNTIIARVHTVAEKAVIAVRSIWHETISWTIWR